ncbi:putative epidermal cell surface receptor isoform X2 [Phymastichus coffea]|uniref:putative epidermal cell surface receptor isoform X2 n=1 Tax=Phymastichus coffea TaxID=108790 RepID=UPI00273B7461|nr:putative epidermal cell surface receptor isoform X2 [Phymastichus coffea]
MTRTRQGWPVLALVACGSLLLLSCVATQEVAAGKDGDIVPGVKPLDSEVSAKKTSSDVTPPDSKPPIELKKKTIAEFSKAKPEIKHQKPLSSKDVKVNDGVETTTQSADFDTTTWSTTVDEKSMKLAEKVPYTIELPLLGRSESIAQVTTTMTPTSTTQQPISISTTTEATKKMESTTTVVGTAMSRARALNVSAGEPTNNLHSNTTDLSDVSMDDEDREVEGGEYIASHNGTSAANVTMVNPLSTVAPMCIDGNRTYAIGEKIKRGCDEQCLCGMGGKIIDCEPMCRTPLIRAGRKNSDPFCNARELPENPCCAILVCSDSAPEPDETCVFGNTTIARGQKLEDGCSKICICEAGGHLKCQQRCPPNETTTGVNQHDRCVVLKDPGDPCCSITLCDVTLGDHEIKPEGPADLSVNLTDVKVLNSTAIKLKLSSKLPDEVTVEISENNHLWRQVKPTKDGILSNLQPGHGYYVRIVEGPRTGQAIHVSLLAEVPKASVTEKSEKGTCNHRGKTYKIGAEWHDECIAVCFCNETAQVECVTIECPTDFGLDVLDPHCLDWETVPPNHVPKAPNCCPQEVRCRNNGSCMYEGKMYENWSQLPTNITGCEKECYCEFGNVTCNPICPPVPPQPSSTLNCKPQNAILTYLPSDSCCLHWACPPSSGPIGPGMNSTTSVFPGPLAIDTTAKQSKDKTQSSKPSQKPPQATLFPWLTTTHPPQPQFPPNSDVVHYPMDPGHPTVPYIGPYNPDFKPTQPSIEDVFHLDHTEKVASVKEKNKSKSDSKKPVDLIKSHKDNIDTFPGPLAPDRFLEKPHISEKPIISPISKPASPNKLPGLNKDLPGHVEQPQFIPLNVPDHDFTPANGENIPQSHFDTLVENTAAGPAYGSRPEDPNNVVPVSKKKLPVSDEKGKPSSIKISQKNPDAIPDELYHLINQQHPGLIELNNKPPTGHPGLYDIHQEIATGDKGRQPYPQQSDYFGPSKKGSKPQIFTQKDESGQTTYHVHAAEVPSTPQQLEDLLVHIAQHDPNANLYQQQHYPVQQQPGELPPRAGDLNPAQAGVPSHLGPHGFVPQDAGQTEYGHGLPPVNPYEILGQANIPTPQTYEINVEDLRAISSNSVRLVFSVPALLVGLHGRVEVRYTSDLSSSEPSQWKSQTFAPPGDLIDTQELEFDLSGLKPATTYKLMIMVRLRDLSNVHSSRVYEVRTLDKRSGASVPADLRIDPEFKVIDVNATFAEFEWKKFTDYELQFVDGIYLMYKAADEKTYSVTPLLHRSVNRYVLDHLRPLTTYEVHLSTKDIIGQANVLINGQRVNFTTKSEVDPYSFDIKVETKNVKATEVEVAWSGVPEPQDKYVNIYRAVYKSDSGKEDTSTFKIAKKDSPAKTIISDLKPGIRYRLWIEVYLTNGKVKKSNVQDFVTKPGISLPPGASQQQGKLASVSLHEGDYYGPLVIVAIVASLAILSTLILLMMLMKRRTSSKADISPRKTTSAYDNPSYKVELQQETMDL